MDVSVLVNALVEKGGVFAVLLIFSGWFNWIQYREIRDGEKDRREEMRANTEKVLTALMGSTATASAGTEALKSLERVVETALGNLNRGTRR